MSNQSGEWLTQAEYDLMTAQDIYKAGRYIYTVYMCHLAIEKALKSLVVSATGNAPPKTHNLIQLAKIGMANLPQEQNIFLAEINTASITTRYPEELASSLKRFNKDIAKEYLQKSEEVIRCITVNHKLKK